MPIKNIDEFGLIKLFTEKIKLDQTKVVLGVGDDSAVLRQDSSKYLLAATDTLTEGVHFLLSTTTPEQLGFKAVSVNVSDIAAMGGVPTALLLALALPKQTELEWVEKFSAGIKKGCEFYGVDLVGGDTVTSLGGITLNLTVLGEVEPEFLVCRSGAKSGDLLGVTGCLGGSAAGLEALTQALEEQNEEIKRAINRHLLPEARLWAARELAKTGKLHSLNDISDGLASEILEITESSGVGVILNAEDVPINQAAIAVAKYTDNDPLDWAIYGGEEYELVFSFPPEAKKEIAGALARVNCSFSIIGEIRGEGEERVIRFVGNSIQPLKPFGYNHFRA